MAQIKRGLDYYAHNVGMTADRRLIGIRREYGSAGIDVLFALYDMLYSNTGYYLEYNDRTRSDVLWELGGIVRGKNSPEDNVIAEIIDAFVVAGLFDKELYSKGILTSVQVQEQFYMSTLKRKIVQVNTSYWLLSAEQMKALSDKSPILTYLSSDDHDDVRNRDNDVRNEKNDVRNSKNDVGMKQSKEKKTESKEKHIESIAEHTPPVSGDVGCADLPVRAEENNSFADKEHTPNKGTDIQGNKLMLTDESGNVPENIVDILVADNRPLVSPILSDNGQQKPETRSGGNSSRIPMPDLDLRDELINIYGPALVAKYEDKFRKWSARAMATHAEMYSQIKKWMSEDISTCIDPNRRRSEKPFTSSIPNIDEVIAELMKKYYD